MHLRHERVESVLFTTCDACFLVEEATLLEIDAVVGGFTLRAKYRRTQAEWSWLLPCERVCTRRPRADGVGARLEGGGEPP